MPDHPPPAGPDGPAAPEVVTAPLQGTVVRLASEAERVSAGAVVAVLESMKMEHELRAPAPGTVTEVLVAVGDTVSAGDELVRLAPGPPLGEATEAPAAPAPVAPAPGARRDLDDVEERHAIGRDERRPEAVARRHDRGRRTARENIADLLDDGSFVEYGPLAVAAQRRRLSVEELIERTPADGLVGGIGTVDGHPVVVASYDYTVLAGTQGFQNHRKKDRLFELAERQRLPVVLFAEGGGGRPGDVDAPGVSGLDVLAFHLFARLSGRVPLVGIVSGRCFAGNAALAACCDVIIATEGTNLGMGGPAMIEGGGLGSFSPEDIGPLDVQVANGVVDVATADEAEAVAVARRYLSYFGPPERRGDPATATSDATAAPDPTAPDPTALRRIVPEQRKALYAMREVIDGLADVASTLELRAGWGPGIVTTLARVEGRPLGVVANDPAHLGGALDPEGCDKAARFLTLCDAFDLPVLFLCDTPGFMVGPEIEAQAMVRHAGRLFTVGANLTVPTMTVIVRKAYGLGAQAMAGGSFKAPLACVSWPTGEVGGMGLEGAVRLGFRRELEAVEDPEARAALFDEMVAKAYEYGKALNSASHFEIDDVIDPADTRRWIAATFGAAPRPPVRPDGKRPDVDGW